MGVVLVGPMGCGKTTVGRQLARSTGLEFVDSDHEIEARTGVDIPYIFEREGEAGFRQREAQVIAELAERGGCVLATGGGAILDAESRRRLAAYGFVVYLHASVEQQLQRTARSRNRPLLKGVDRAATLENLLEQRDPLYREIADLIIETGKRPARAVAMEIVRGMAQAEADRQAGTLAAAHARPV
ncbi:MAG: shikimate kinase AroK [Nevskiaceae bacterium]|nr:MAG: shikimate kinase AroK [Nevskiaceae bacterium]TBR72808.1 MAG: shikimate kinase AroK [Nevskiaceae bacterium]